VVVVDWAEVVGKGWGEGVGWGEAAAVGWEVVVDWVGGGQVEWAEVEAMSWVVEVAVVGGPEVVVVAEKAEVQEGAGLRVKARSQAAGVHSVSQRPLVCPAPILLCTAALFCALATTGCVLHHVDRCFWHLQTDAHIACSCFQFQWNNSMKPWRHT
jgi:hypothetical protein